MIRLSCSIPAGRAAGPLGAEADVAGRGQLHPPARLAAGGAFAADEGQAAPVAPEQFALSRRECLAGTWRGSHIFSLQSGIASI